MNDPRLDRRPEFDRRSRDYPVLATIPPSQPRSYTWGCDLVLDQGQEGACVGFSIAHELRARPKVVNGVDTALARQIYHRARQLDPWEGEAYEGTSILAGLKAAQEKGLLKSYHWAFGADELALAVSRKGPAIVGIDWYESMYDPQRQEQELYTITRQGSVVGGHAILCVGYNRTRRQFCLHNSWGKGWGFYGRAWIGHDDMSALLRAGGEAAVPHR